MPSRRGRHLGGGGLEWWCVVVLFIVLCMLEKKRSGKLIGCCAEGKQPQTRSPMPVPSGDSVAVWETDFPGAPSAVVPPHLTAYCACHLPALGCVCGPGCHGGRLCMYAAGPGSVVVAGKQSSGDGV